MTMPATSGLDLARLLPPMSHGSTADAVTDALREAIASGLLPPGARLREVDVASSLGVSRTPVREALRRLSDERLTLREPNRGAAVAPVTIEEIIAVYDVREALEALASASAASARTEEQLDALESVQQRLSDTEPTDLDRLASLNLEFHGRIRHASGNAMLEHFLAQVDAAVRRFGVTTYAAPDRPSQSLREHREIIDAIADRDADRAARVTAAHMHHARDLRIKQVTRIERVTREDGLVPTEHRHDNGRKPA